MMRPGDKPTLHEILMADKLDFEAKVERAAKRKRWLKGTLFCFGCAGAAHGTAIYESYCTVPKRSTT